MSIATRCHNLIGKLYERPVTKMDGGLTIVSMPSWMEAKDIDLIKEALKAFAERHPMNSPRIIPCAHCQSEGRLYRGQYEDERDCGECPACEGTGGEIVDSEPVELAGMNCADCGAGVNPMLFPCLEQTCPQRSKS